MQEIPSDAATWPAKLSPPQDPWPLHHWCFRCDLYFPAFLAISSCELRMASLRMRFNESVCASRTMLSNLLLPWLQEIGAMQRFYPCQASWRHKKIKLTVHAVERKDAQKTRTCIKARNFFDCYSKLFQHLPLIMPSGSHGNLTTFQSWQHIRQLPVHRLRIQKDAKGARSFWKSNPGGQTEYSKNSKESIICSCFWSYAVLFCCLSRQAISTSCVPTCLGRSGSSE